MTQKFTKINILLLTAAAFYAFLVFGFSDNLKGPILPAVLADLKISYATGGAILMSIYIGFMAATLSAGFIADKFGQKVVLVNAGICLTLGVIGFTFSSLPILLTLSMIVLGYGLGSLELGCNSLIVALHPTNQARYLNLMAVMHGMGSMLAPLYVGWALAAGTSWRVVYRWDVALTLILIVVFTASSFPKQKPAESQTMDFKHIGAKAFSPTMVLFYFAQLIYVAFELGIASWMVEFLQKIQHQDVNQSTQALSIFFGLVMVGRLVGSFLVDRVGHLRSVLLAALASSACVAAGLFGPPQLAWLLPGSGLFLSIIFPTITAAVSGTNSENMNTILGLLFTFAGLGGIVGPWLVGVASDLGGIQFGFGLNLAFGLLTAGAALVLMRRTAARGGARA